MIVNVTNAGKMSIAPEFNSGDPEAVEIRRKAAAVGAQLNDVITIEEVRAFERQAGVKLPEDYVWFITNVGNGGTWLTCLPGKRYKFYKLPANGNAYNFAHYARGYSFPNGKDKFALGVLDLGDGYEYGIILTGEHFGEICDICDTEYAYYEDDKTVHNFKELYTAWLDDEYLGYDTDYFDRRLRGTVEELFEKYLDQKEDHYLGSIALKINKNCASTEFIERVYTEFMREYNNDKQTALCDILMKSGYPDPLSIIKRIYRPKNYLRIIGYLKDDLIYFDNWLKADGVMDGAKDYYPILVEILKYLNTLTEFSFEGLHFKQCFEMTVMNPKFNENDIAEVLNSKNKVILELITHTYAEPVLNRVGKYVEAAKKKVK